MGVTTLLFLFAFLIFVDCFHINVDVKSESSLTESKSESTEIKDFRNRVIDLGNSLSKRMKRPPKDGGKEFMKDLREYNEQTKKLLAMVKKDPPPGLRKFVDEYLYKHTHIMERNVPEDAIKENFNWMDSSMQRFYDERNVTGTHYTEFVTIRNRCVD